MTFYWSTFYLGERLYFQEQWNNVLWADGKKVEMFGYNEQCYIWWKPCANCQAWWWRSNDLKVFGSYGFRTPYIYRISHELFYIPNHSGEHCVVTCGPAKLHHVTEQWSKALQQNYWIAEKTIKVFERPSQKPHQYDVNINEIKWGCKAEWKLLQGERLIKQLIKTSTENVAFKLLLLNVLQQCTEWLSMLTFFTHGL